MSGQLEHYKEVVHDITFTTDHFKKLIFSEVTFHKRMHLKWNILAHAQWTLCTIAKEFPPQCIVDILCSSKFCCIAIIPC